MKNTRSLFLSTLTALALAAVSSVTHADIVYSNFGPGDTFNAALNYPVYGPSTGITTNSQSAAAFFTPTQNYTLTSFDMAVQHLVGTNSFMLSLVTDNSGLPTGTAIVSPFSVSFTSSGIPAVPVVDSFSATGSLLAGQKYWLVMTPGTPQTAGYWSANSTGIAGAAIQQNGGNWDNYSFESPAFRINGRPTAPALTPEMPAGVQAISVLLAVGGMALYQRKKKATQS